MPSPLPSKPPNAMMMLLFIVCLHRKHGNLLVKWNVSRANYLCLFCWVKVIRFEVDRNAHNANAIRCNLGQRGIEWKSKISIFHEDLQLCGVRRTKLSLDDETYYVRNLNRWRDHFRQFVSISIVRLRWFSIFEKENIYIFHRNCVRKFIDSLDSHERNETCKKKVRYHRNYSANYDSMVVR